MHTLTHPRPAIARRDYAALLLTVCVRNRRLLPKFVAAIPGIIDQAAECDGIVCYGFDIDWQRLTFRTIAVADEIDVLQEFARSGEHGRLAAELAGRLGPVSVDRFAVPGTAIPRTWDDVEALPPVTEQPACSR